MKVTLVIHASKVDEIYKEARALSKLVHSNIIKLYHAFLLKTDVVLIMEYISGGELYKFVKDKGDLTELEARNIFQQLTYTVEYCHDKYIIHRDLKPTNILISESDSGKIVIKLIDFGISGSNYGKDKSTAGSLVYMPPEVISNTDTTADPAIDIWAMGIILYFMIYGHIPFSGRTEKEAAKAILTHKIPFIHEKKIVSKKCKDLIIGMLEKNPKKRMKITEIIQADWLNISDEELEEFDKKAIIPKKENIEETKINKTIISKHFSQSFKISTNAKHESNKGAKKISAYSKIDRYSKSSNKDSKKNSKKHSPDKKSLISKKDA